MPASRNYSSTAGLMHLVGGIAGADASLVVDVTTGLPTVPFTLMLDPGLGVEEVVTVTAVGGTTLTVTRGVGGTSAQAHTNGAEVRHAYYGQDFQDSRDHEAATVAHGATGAVVGTTNVQTLTNKTIGSSQVTGLDTHIAATVAHGATGAVVGTTNVQTLTNKTLTAPVIAALTNANHVHKNAATGGVLPYTASGTVVATPDFSGIIIINYGVTFTTIVWPVVSSGAGAIICAGSGVTTSTGWAVLYDTTGNIVNTGTRRVNWSATGILA